MNTVYVSDEGDDNNDGLTEKTAVRSLKHAIRIAIRSGVIADFTVNYPNDKAMANAANTAKWNMLSKEMADVSKLLADEAGKAKPDQKMLGGLIKRLDANCTRCHNDFRD